MERLGPKCEHCGKCALSRATDWRALAVARITAIHGGDVVCHHCGKPSTLTAHTEWVPME